MGGGEAEAVAGVLCSRTFFLKLVSDADRSRLYARLILNLPNTEKAVKTKQKQVFCFHFSSFLAVYLLFKCRFVAR